MHENNPLHTFTTVVHVSVVAFAMNARYPGQFPNCSERQTKRERENEMTAALKGKRRWDLEKDDMEKVKERENVIRCSQRCFERSRIHQNSLSVSPRSFAEHATLHSPTYSLSVSVSVSITSNPILFVPLSLPFATCARASKRSNAPASQHGPAPSSCITVSLDLHDLHESPRDPTAYKQTSRTEEKGTDCFTNVSSAAFHRRFSAVTVSLLIVLLVLVFVFYDIASISFDPSS